MPDWSAIEPWSTDLELSYSARSTSSYARRRRLRLKNIVVTAAAVSDPASDSWLGLRWGEGTSLSTSVLIFTSSAGAVDFRMSNPDGILDAEVFNLISGSTKGQPFSGFISGDFV